MSDLLSACENIDCVLHNHKTDAKEIEVLRVANKITIYQGRDKELRLCARCAHAADTYHAFLKQVSQAILK